ncbi:MAG: hypothetical protein NWQ95_02410 [Verrucomicrobiales bacterium]|nr:hypothetical protein [Verrucomicrobiales bacterium]
MAGRAGESCTSDRDDGALKTLAGTYPKVGDSGAALALLGSRSLQFRLRPKQNQDASMKMKTDELQITLESIALFA